MGRRYPSVFRPQEPPFPQNDSRHGRQVAVVAEFIGTFEQKIDVIPFLGSVAVKSVQYAVPFPPAQFMFKQNSNINIALLPRRPFSIAAEQEDALYRRNSGDDDVLDGFNIAG
jgi:hypothetical protein